PREGAHAGPGALRGLGVLRPADPRTAGGLAAAAFAGTAQLPAGAEPGVADELRRAAVAVLALGRAAPPAGGPAWLRCRNPLLERGLPPVPLAFAGAAHAGVP